MKKQLVLLVGIALFATSLFAHGGHAHTYMGTVTMIHGADEFMIRTTDGKEVTITTSPKTVFLHTDNHAATRSELAVGSRVVVKMKSDGKTAATVKMSAAKGKVKK